MIAGKVWGYTIELLKTPMVEFHRIGVLEYSKCSKHKHLHKWNGFYVHRGRLLVHVFKDYGLDDVTILNPGDFMAVPPGELHYFETEDEEVEAFELYWLGPITEDIIRESVGARTRG